MARRTLDTEKHLFDPDLCMGYAAFVRSGRGVLGISQNAFAAMLGVHRTTLVRLEQGSPPLKHNLLEAAQRLLADLGLKLNTTLSQNELGDINVSELQFTIPIESLRRVQKLLDRGGSDDEFIRQLFGDQYVPPLKAKPLRRKIKRLNTQRTQQIGSKNGVS